MDYVQQMACFRTHRYCTSAQDRPSGDEAIIGSVVLAVKWTISPMLQRIKIKKNLCSELVEVKATGERVENTFHNTRKETSLQITIFNQYVQKEAMKSYST